MSASRTTPPEPRSELAPLAFGRGRLLALSALIAAAACIPYAGVLDAPFVFDDVKLVQENELLRAEGIEGWERIARSFNVFSRAWDAEEVRENYRPLRFLSYAIDYRLSRALLDTFDPDDPPVLFFHLQNVLWHVLNALLVFAVARRLAGSEPAALAASLLFALHPIQTEAVTYISSRRDVLSTFFFLSALALYLGTPAREPLRWRALLAGPPLFALGFLAKEMVITLPAVVLLIDLVRRPAPEWRRLTFHAALWAVVAVSVTATLANPGLVAEGGAHATGSVIGSACRYIARYLGLVAFPVSQSIDYSFDAIPATRSLLDPGTTLPSVALAVGLLVAALALWRARLPVLALGLLWFLGTLTPVLQIVPIAEPFAERFAYLPSIGVFLAAGWLLAGLRRYGPFLGRGALCVVAIVLLALTVRRNGDWESRLDLWASAAGAEPRCARAHMAYGMALKDEGRTREAVGALSRALAIWDEDPDRSLLHQGHYLRARTVRGSLYGKLGEDDPASLEKAVEDLRFVLASTDTDGVVIESSPEYALIHFELAGCLEALGATDEALEEYRRLIEIGGPPSLVVRSRYEIHQVLLERGQPDAALDELDAILASTPAGGAAWFQTQLHRFEVLFAHKRAYDAARGFVEGLLEERTARDEKVALLLRLARVLDRQGDLSGCIARLEAALELDPRAVAVLETLAPIETMRGHRERARKLYQRVLEIEPSNRAAANGLRQLALRETVGAAQDVRGRDEAIQKLESVAVTAVRHHDRGEWTAARQAWAEVLRNAADLRSEDLVVRAYQGIARAEARLGRHAEALAALEQALKLSAGKAETLRSMADIHVAYLERPDAACELYRRYLEELPAGEPGDPGVLIYLAGYLAKSSAGTAIEYYERVRSVEVEGELSFRLALLHKTMGRLYGERGEWEKAFSALDEYLRGLGDRNDSERLAVEKYLNEVVLPNLLGEAAISGPGSE